MCFFFSELFPPRLLRASAITTSSLTLNWLAPAVGMIDSYFLHYQPTSVSLPIVVDPDTLDYQLSELSPGQEYTFLLSVYSDLAGESATIEVKATTG